MTILITGAAGFIGSELCLRLLDRGETVVGLDNHNDYYNPKLKEDRVSRYLNNPNYTHIRIDIADKLALEKVFENYEFNRVVNLAAQAGVRYSIENPRAYIDSNIVGFLNILECCKNKKIKHLVYASSSSVYGSNKSLPFAEHDNVDHPLSLYAATKKSNELMAHTYSHLYELPTTGLRFFTVYGPWGRPDMALFKFTNLILSGKKIPVYNHGKHRRDFTFISDVVDAVVKVIDNSPERIGNPKAVKPANGSSAAPWRIYNVGNSKPIDLLDYIKAIETSLGKKAVLDFLPLQPGDVGDTYASVDKLMHEYKYKPSTTVEVGVKQFVDWYQTYYGLS